MKRGLPPALEVMATLDERLGTSWERPLWPHAMDGVGVQNYATRCSIVLNTHMVLRRHDEEDAVVLDAAVRSWPPVAPRCLRWAWPVWMTADDLDPTALKSEFGRRRSSGDDEDEPPSYDAASFAVRFLDTEPKSVVRILEEAEGEGLSSRRVKRLLDLAEEDGLAFRWSIGSRKSPAYATAEPPEEKMENSRALVEAILRQEADLSAKDIAKRCDVSVRYVQRIRRELEANNDANSGAN